LFAVAVENLLLAELVSEGAEQGVGVVVHIGPCSAFFLVLAVQVRLEPPAS